MYYKIGFNISQPIVEVYYKNDIQKVAPPPVATEAAATMD